ncbi:MAG: hypothetical protein PHS33_09120 [Candidatus Omnitrophica bacterium]|nr:hypothetical protein [Candidatus Omnitrophota bacterium]
MSAIRQIVDQIFNDPKFRDKMSNFEIFTGLIKDVDYINSFAVVDTGVTTYVDCVIPMSQVNAYLDKNKNKKIFGLFHNYTQGAFVIGVHLKRIQKRFLLASFPTFAADQYQNLLDDVPKGINRIPIKNTDKRDFDTTGKTDLLDTDIVKWGEYLIYSSGLAAFMLDYIGNILVETEREFHIRVGDRNATTAKITAPEVEVVVGRMLKDDATNGAIEDTTLNSKNTKIKIDVNTVSGTTVTNKFNLTVNADGDCILKNPNTEIRINSDGTIYLGEASLEKMVLGETLKNYIDSVITATFNAHTHPYIIPLMPIATGPTLASLTPITPEATPYLSVKNKNK